MWLRQQFFSFQKKVIQKYLIIKLAGKIVKVFLGFFIKKSKKLF